MSEVLIWDDEKSFENGDILIFQDDVYYDLFLDGKYEKKPSFCYVLSPNYSVDMLPMLIYYIYLKHDDICLRNFFLDENHQFKIWENLITALNTFDINYFKESYFTIKNTYIFSQYKGIFKWIEDYFSFIIEPFVNSLYFNTSSSDKNKNWLTNKLNTKVYFDNYLKEVSKGETSNFIEHSKKLVEEKIKILNKFDNNVNKLFYMSCFCYQMVQHYFQLNQFQLSFTLLQRTLDFYLQSRALENSLIVPTAYGMKFNYTYDYENKPVGIFFLEKCLIDYGNLKYDKERREFLTWLNETRNTLICTHGVFNVEKKNVEDAIIKTEKTIFRIEGSKHWEIQSKKFSFTSDFSNMTLFDLEPSIELYFSLQQTLE